MRLAVLLVVVACGRQPAPPPTGSGAPPPALTQECEVSECGPRMGMPNRVCPDGSVAGPTGRCLRKPDGRCAWEIRNCP